MTRGLERRPPGDDQHPMRPPLARPCGRFVSASRQVVTALPEVNTRQRSADDLAIVIASDGLFGSVYEPFVSSEQVADIARSTLQICGNAGDAESKTARRLVDYAVKERNGSDNTTVVVVTLDPPCMPLRESRGGPVELEHVGSQQSLTTVQAPSPGRGFNDRLHVPFLQAYPPTEPESDRRTPSPQRLDIEQADSVY